MNPAKLEEVDQKTNKLLNKEILFFLKRLKTLLGFYADQKQMDVHLPMDSIQQIQSKSIRESYLCEILGKCAREANQRRTDQIGQKGEHALFVQQTEKLQRFDHQTKAQTPENSA